PEGTLPDGVDYLAADLSTAAGVDGLCTEIDAFKPTVAVNCAGINRISAFAEIDPADFEEIQQINVTAPFRICRAAVPNMKAGGWGRIVNIASVWSKVGKEFRASYATSKFGLVGMTSALAAEVSEFGILANCVSPGVIETEMTRSVLDDAQIEGLLQMVPARRLGTPEEVARFVFWLGGPDNTFISGQNIAIDGGMTRV
ncbi:MAG: SDR family oxidoreductase, partial [Rhodospirillaceae bacterium]